MPSEGCHADGRWIPEYALADQVPQHSTQGVGVGTDAAAKSSMGVIPAAW